MWRCEHYSGAYKPKKARVVDDWVAGKIRPCGLIRDPTRRSPYDSGILTATTVSTIHHPYRPRGLPWNPNAGRRSLAESARDPINTATYRQESSISSVGKSFSAEHAPERSSVGLPRHAEPLHRAGNAVFNYRITYSYSAWPRCKRDYYSSQK